MRNEVRSGALRAGDVVLLTTAASVQFSRPIVVRVIRELPDRYTYDGWLWLDAYELGRKGEAVARHELFVMRGGVRMRPARPQRSGTAQPWGSADARATEPLPVEAVVALPGLRHPVAVLGREATPARRVSRGPAGPVDPPGEGPGGSRADLTRLNPDIALPDLKPRFVGWAEAR